MTNSPLSTAIEAVRKAGDLLKEKTGENLVVNESKDHDIKLELDVLCQNLLTRHFLDQTPDFSILGEEGEHGNSSSEFRWIVDPIDGTVNFFYGLPHYCITVALQKKSPTAPQGPVPDSIEGPAPGEVEGYETILGVTFDPVRNELFSAEKGKGSFLNGHPIRVSSRRKISDAIMAIGFSKTNETAKLGMGPFQTYTLRARKLRVMGSAALDLAYVAAGRLDAYHEWVRIWDIAAGLLLVSEAGGRVHTHAIPNHPHLYSTLAFNNALPFTLKDGKLEEL
jgi:myo-inositol-1(or 4)-monophosphatase